MDVHARYTYPANTIVGTTQYPHRILHKNSLLGSDSSLLAGSLLVRLGFRSSGLRQQPFRAYQIRDDGLTGSYDGMAEEMVCCSCTKEQQQDNYPVRPNKSQPGSKQHSGLRRHVRPFIPLQRISGPFGNASCASLCLSFARCLGSGRNPENRFDIRPTTASDCLRRSI